MSTPRPYHFYRPKSLSDARRRIDENLKSIETMEAKLADSNWTDKAGRRLSRALYHNQRHRTIHALGIKKEDNRQLRNWIAEQVDAMESERLDFDVTDCHAVLAEVVATWKGSLKDQHKDLENTRVFKVFEKAEELAKGHAGRRLY